nr:major histocompatibility complex class I-related gene protein-like [Pogona vitticeps]
MSEELCCEAWQVEPRVVVAGTALLLCLPLIPQCGSLSGFHSLQWMYSCELRADGSKRGHMQYGYDGRDYIALDKETLTWTAAVPKAQITKHKWEKELAIAQRQKEYLEEICIEWLQKYLAYGKERLLRRGEGWNGGTRRSPSGEPGPSSLPPRCNDPGPPRGYLVDGQRVTRSLHTLEVLRESWGLSKACVKHPLTSLP